MKSHVRLMLWMTVICSTLFVGSKTADAKTAFIERQGDRVHVTYRYGDSHRLELSKPPRRSDHELRHTHFYYLLKCNPYSFHGNPFGFYQSYRYPLYIR